MTQNDDLSWKINLFTLGNSSVGKSSFILRYIKDTFKTTYLATIGIDFMIKTIKLPSGKNAKICFYDTAGQEQYKSISFNLIKGADGILLMYDISNKESFDSISGWIESIKEVKGNDFPIELIGNKCDLSDERVVQKEEGKKIADDNGFMFFETSNKNRINIDESILALVNTIIEQKKKQDDMKLVKTDSIKIKNTNMKKKKKCC